MLFTDNTSIVFLLLKPIKFSFDGLGPRELSVFRNSYTSHKQYLFRLLTSRKAKMTQTEQSIPCAFLLCLKRNNPQILTSASYKNPFLQCVCYGSGAEGGGGVFKTSNYLNPICKFVKFPFTEPIKLKKPSPAKLLI